MTEQGEPRPFFLEGSSGKLFSIFYPPPSSVPAPQVVVHAPAFAEEMNKSRRMVSLQAAELARRGIGVLVFDLFGTGDSEGDFGEASWDRWLDDLGTACRWAENQTVARISLWGLRMGALLAMDFAVRQDRLFEKLLLWHPVLNGNNLVMQFLRLRVASALFTGQQDSAPETTSTLRERLLAGQSAEVAGYELGPDLVNPLMKLRLAQFDPTRFKSIQVSELVSEAGKPGSAANREWISATRNQGLSVDFETVSGPFFWSTQEIALAPALLERTTRSMG